MEDREIEREERNSELLHELALVSLLQRVLLHVLFVCCGCLASLA
jgi:hypothetical protein